MRRGRAAEPMVMTMAKAWRGGFGRRLRAAAPWGGGKEKSGRGMCGALFGAGVERSRC